MEKQPGGKRHKTIEKEQAGIGTQGQEKNIFSEIWEDIKQTFQDKTNVIILVPAFVLGISTIGVSIYYTHHIKKTKAKVVKVLSPQNDTKKITPMKPKIEDKKENKEQQKENQGENPPKITTQPQKDTDTTDSQSYERMKKEVESTGQLTLGYTQEDINNLPRIINMLNSEKKEKNKKKGK